MTMPGASVEDLGEGCLETGEKGHGQPIARFPSEFGRQDVPMLSQAVDFTVSTSGSTIPYSATPYRS
jgi:hypothetical protein